MIHNVSALYWKSSPANFKKGELSQPAFACSKLTVETLEQGMKYVQS